MKYLSLSLFLLSFLFLQACSTTQQSISSGTPDQDTGAETNFPSWFEGAKITSDSLSIFSSATTLSGDSLNAAKTAEKEARMLLEQYIGDRLEDIRMGLNLQGDKTLAEESFVFNFRNAHQRIEEMAALGNLSVQREGDGYRGFSEVRIERVKIMSMLDGSLSNYPEQWGKIRRSSGFSDVVQL